MLDLLSYLRNEDKAGKTSGFVHNIIGILESSTSEKGNYDALPIFLEMLLQRDDLFNEKKGTNVYLRLCLVRALNNLQKGEGFSDAGHDHYRIVDQLMKSRDRPSRACPNRKGHGSSARGPLIVPAQPDQGASASEPPAASSANSLLV